MWMGYRIGGLYVVQVRPTLGVVGWLSESSSDFEIELELEAPSLDVPLESQSTGQRDEQDAHTSTS